MRVIILNDRAVPFGGAERVVIASAQALAARGHDVHLIGGARPGDPRPEGVTVHAIEERPLIEAGWRAAVRGLWNRRTAASLERVWKMGDPSRTVVHIHDWSRLLTSSVIRRSLDLGAPTVLTMHDYTVACPNGAFYDFPAAAICLRTPLGASCVLRNCDRTSYAHKLWRVVRACIQRTCGRTHDARLHYVSVSEFARDIQARHLPAASDIRVVNNPLSAHPSGRSYENGVPYVVFAGRMTEEKGPTLAAEAARAAGVACVFAGDGALLAQLELRFPMHRFVGQLDPAELYELMSGAIAVVVPSLWYETQNLVAWEAASLGVPVIATAGTAPGDLVERSTGGVVFAHGDVGQLTQVLASAVDDRDAFAALGAAGRSYVVAQRRTINAHVDRLESLYAEIVTGGAG